MTAQENKAILLQFLEGLRKGNMAAVNEVCSEEFVFHLTKPSRLAPWVGRCKATCHGSRRRFGLAPELWSVPIVPPNHLRPVGQSDATNQRNQPHQIPAVV